MKQDNTTKLSVKLRREILLLCIMLISAVFVGCASEGDEEKIDPKLEETLETMEEPLRIFYDGSGEYLIKSFMSAHPEVNIQLIECIRSGEDEVDMQDIISNNGVPDLIIGSEEISGYLSEWHHEGYTADLLEFCSSDVSINTDDYFPETFEIFSEERILYALPLGISLDFMLTSESKYYDSTFAKLEEGYTGRKLVNVMLEEVHKEKENGEFFSEINRSPLRWMYCLDGVTQTDDGIQMDEELFKQVYELSYKNQQLQNKARSFWSEQSKAFNGSTGYAFPCALDPRRYEGKFTVDIGSLEDAPAVVLPYAETAYQYHTEEGIKAIYLPTADDGSQYQARVKIWGAIAEESKRKELAYELLRALMDEEINSFGMVRGASPEDKNVYPINKANAISLLGRFESQTSMLMYENDLKAERIDISSEERDKHDEVLKNISGLYCWTKELNEVSAISNVYFEADISDYESCYLDMLNTLNSGDINEYMLNISDSSSEEEGNSEVLKEEHVERAGAQELKEKIKNTEIGSTFFLGETEQDNNTENGTEPIEWLILEKTEDKVFVICKKVIEWIPFSKYEDKADEEGIEGGSINDFTWNIDQNQQHDWLFNGLYKEGFTESEKEIIVQTHNITTDSVLIGTWQLESDDYLYIPSKEEVETYIPDVANRKAEMTVFVAEKAKKNETEYICWSLRTEGPSSRYTSQILENGELGAFYTNVPNGVRPVMWLDIS